MHFSVFDDWCSHLSIRSIRVRAAVAVPGRTVLVFLPGKREIEQMLFLFQLDLGGGSGAASAFGASSAAEFDDSIGDEAPVPAAALLPSFGTITFGVLHSEVPQDIQRATLLPPEPVRSGVIYSALHSASLLARDSLACCRAGFAYAIFAFFCRVSRR